MYKPSKFATITSAPFIAIFALVGLLTSALPASADCTAVGGTVVLGECQILLPQTLAGGTYVVPSSLRITPAGSLTVSPTAAGNSVTLKVAGNFTIDARLVASQVALSGNSSSVASAITVEADGNILLDTNILGTIGGHIAANGPSGCSGSARAGNITLTSTMGNVTLKGGSQINSLGGCLGGEIVLQALAGSVTVGGIVKSRGGTTATSDVVRGGPITVAAAGNLTVAPSSSIISDSTVTGSSSAVRYNYGADLVHLESGGNMTIMGLVQSSGGFSYGLDAFGKANRCTRDLTKPDLWNHKRDTPTACAEVWVGGTLTMNAGDPALGNANTITGRINARSGSSGLENGTCCTWIEVLVRGDMTLQGQPSIVSSNAFMIDAQQGSNNAFGGEVLIRSLQGKITASGRTVVVDGVSQGGHGGSITMEAAGPRVYPAGIFHAADFASNVDLGDSMQYARGSSVGAIGGAGTILIRSYNGQITGGPADRPGTGRGGCVDRFSGAPLIDPSTGLQYPCNEFAGTLNASGLGSTRLLVTLCDGWLYNGITVPRALTSAPTCGGTPPAPPPGFPIAPTIKIFGGVYQYDGFERPATGDHDRPAGDVALDGFDPDPLAGPGHRIARVRPTAFGQPGLDANGNQRPPLPNGSPTPALALSPLPTITYVDSANNPLPSALNPFAVPVNVGTYTATAFFPGNAVYTPLTATAPITIFAANRLTPVVKVTGGIYQYDGLPHPATGPTAAVGSLPTTEDAATGAFIVTPGIYYSKYTEGSNTGAPCAFDATPGWTPQTDPKCTTTPPVLTTTTKTPPNVTPSDGIQVLAYFPGNTQYGPAWATARIAIWTTRPSVTTATGGTFVYNGSPHPTTTAVRDAASNPAFLTARTNVNDATWTFGGNPSGVTYRTFDPLNPNLSTLGAVSVDAPVNVGTYPVTAWYPGDSSHSGSYGTNVIIITKRPNTFTMPNATLACDGSPHGLTATIRDTTLNTVLTGITPVFTYTDSAGNPVLPGPPVTAGTYTVTASLPLALAGNYSVSSVTATLTITIRTATITATGGTFVFDGNAHPATATVSGTGVPAGTQATVTYTRGGVATGTPREVGVYTATATLPPSLTGCYTPTTATTTITITAPPDPTEEACLVVDLREITYFKNSSVITSSDSGIRSKNGLSGGFKPSLWPYSATAGYDKTTSRGTLFRIYGFKASEVGNGIPDFDVPGKTYVVKEDTQIPGPGRFYIELNEPGGAVGGHPARVFICPSRLQKNVIDQNVCKTSTGGGDDKDGKDDDGKDDDSKDGKDGSSSGKDAKYAGDSYGGSSESKDGKDSSDDGKDGKDGSTDDSSCSTDDGKDGKDSGSSDDGKDGKDGSSSGKDAKYAGDSYGGSGDDGKDGKDSSGSDDKDGGCTSCTPDDGVFSNSAVLTSAEKNVPGIMLTHNASALTVPQRVRTELNSLGIPLQNPPGTAATRAAIDYVAVQHWGGGSATFREFVDVRVTFVDDSQSDRRQHYAAGLHTAKNISFDDADAFGCNYLDSDPTNDTIRLNDNWDGTHVGDPNWGPACGTREPSANQKKRETADVMYNTAQLLSSVNTDGDTVRLFFGGLRPLAAASASVSGAFTTYTQGGWGASPNGNNPGALLASKFSTVYPSGSVYIGGTKRLTFTSASAIAGFLPQGATPSVLTASATNPTSSSAGVFAGQVLALRLSVDFSNAGVTRGGLASKKVASGKLAGYTVAQVLTLANTVIGGSTASLPSGVSVSDLNSIVDAINNNYDNGTTNKGYLQ